MITASEAKQMVEDNPKRKQAYLYCQFINELAIRRAVAAGKNYAIGKFSAYPNILNENAIAKLTDEDWLSAGKLAECVTINDKTLEAQFEFRSEISEWLRSLGYDIENMELDDGKVYPCITW